jgi:tRNA (cmo5U34)-methyltransferase
MSDFTSIKQWLKSTEDEPLETMSGFFDRRVDSYEDHMRPWRAYYRWLGELIPAQAETLLDLGCGTGLELDEIFRLHPDIRVTGIDLAPGMLARLREKHPERKLTLTVGDYLTVPLAPCAFDVAVAFETLHHFPPETKLGLFRRIFAALRPGGMLLEGDYIAESDEMETYLFQELARRRARQHVPEGTFVHFDTPLTLAHELSLLSQAGFTAEVLGYRGEDNTPMIRAIKP